MGSQMMELEECKRRRHVGQLVKIVEIGERTIAPLAIEAAHIRCAIHRHKHRILAANPDGAFRVAGIQGEFRRHLCNKAHKQRAVNAHPRALHIGPCGLPHGNGFVIAKFAANFLEDFHGLIVNEFHRLVRHHLVGGNIAHQRWKRRHGNRPQGTPALAPAAPLARCRHLLCQFHRIDHYVLASVALLSTS